MSKYMLVRDINGISHSLDVKDILHLDCSLDGTDLITVRGGNQIIAYKNMWEFRQTDSITKRRKLKLELAIYCSIMFLALAIGGVTLYALERYGDLPPNWGISVSQKCTN